MSLIWPYPTRDTSMFRRIDQGWDLQVPVGTPIYAVADGVIHFAHNAAGFGDPYPVLTLTTPINGNTGVYYGHQHPECQDGTHVARGTVIAHAAQVPGGNASNLPGWLEIGWWINGPTGNGQSMHDTLVNAPLLTPTQKVTPMYDPPLALRPIVAALPHPGGGEALLGDDGSVYAFDCPFNGGANNKPYFSGRRAALLELRQGAAGTNADPWYRIIDTANEKYGDGGFG